MLYNIQISGNNIFFPYLSEIPLAQSIVNFCAYRASNVLNEEEPKIR